MKECVTNVHGSRSRKIPASAAVIAEGRFAFVSGQGPLDPELGEFVRGSISEQTTLTMECLQRVVEKAGGSMADIVSCRVYLQPLTNETFAAMNAAYDKFFPDSKPARTTIGCQLLNIDVEIDCIVKLP